MLGRIPGSSLGVIEVGLSKNILRISCFVGKASESFGG